MPTLEFKGKQHIYAHHLSVPYRPLIPDESKSATAFTPPPYKCSKINPNTPESQNTDSNLIIHGDNLHALKALLPAYAGRIKCIYIDPPYNTGNENWIYNDRVNSPLMREWLDKNTPIDGEDLERHDKWLCMMWPRLQLLHELLADDGAIFISIDDNEQHHLRAIMDEVFGEENFRNIITTRRGVKNVQAQFEYVDRLNSGQEYMMFFSKSPDTKFRHLTVHDDSRAVGSWNNHWRGTDRPTMRYKLMGKTPETGQWRWSEERSLAAITNYERLLEEIGDTQPSQSQIDEWWFAQSPSKLDLLRMSTNNAPEHYVPPSDRRILSSLWTDMVINESRSMMNSLETDFQNPKRVDLVKRVIGYITTLHENDIVLDSFAGSGTTAHAVLQLNKEDGGNRKFILVECEDYADNITAERVRRVINGVPNARDASLREGLGGHFTYCTLGKPITMQGMLNGQNLPEYSALASYLLHCATGMSVNPNALAANSHAKDHDTGFFYESDHVRYHLLYKQDIEWLRDDKGALNYERAMVISEYAKDAGKSAVVFAPMRYMSQSDLTSMHITFCQLPYELTASRAQALES